MMSCLGSGGRFSDVGLYFGLPFSKLKAFEIAYLLEPERVWDRRHSLS